MKRAILSLFILLLFPLKSHAIAISSPYLENDTLKLIKGESKIYTIKLQNTGDTDIDVKIIYDSEIAEIIGYKEMYTLPAGKLDTEVSFNITSPKTAMIGNVYTVSYSMKPLTPSGEGAVPLITTISKKFNVEIIKDPNSFDMRVLLDYAVPVIAIIILITILIWKKSKKR